MTSADCGADTVAQRVARSVASDDPRRSLRGDSVHFVRTVALSVGIQGPTAGVIVGPAIRISPSSPSRSRAPASGVPTVPSRIRSGGLQVTMIVSDDP